ncbi:hypothetical protein M5K25_014456 [Dendrobium thyrsiflorum]|uniref:Uncharacterized protein n=1 Tax=Dendrobium thyrsiflorum TaxID=117978 RepID=A0ABD0V3E3_DENTH
MAAPNQISHEVIIDSAEESFEGASQAEFSEEEIDLIPSASSFFLFFLLLPEKMAGMNQISQEVIIDSAENFLSVGVSEESFEGASQAEFSEEEIDLIVRIYKLIGERWSLIAGRIPGRTAEEIEKYWKSKHASSA